MKDMKKSIKVLNENRKAFHDYSILQRLEVGIELTGAEVKSSRLKNVSLAGSYVQVLDGELWLVGASIANYKNSNWCFSAWKHSEIFFKRVSETGSLETRARKLLCHKKERLEIKHNTEAKGLTAIPLKMYSKNGKIKLEIALAKGKNSFDKRNSLKDKVVKRDIERFG